MNLDPVTVNGSAELLALDRKTISFNLPVNKTNKTASGNGTLFVNSTENPEVLQVGISVVIPPNELVGTIKGYSFYLDQDEVDSIRASTNPLFQLKCIKPTK